MTAIAVPAEYQEKMLQALQEEGFLNEPRFAAAFANDALRFKKWGRIRIQVELGRKGVPFSLISDTLDALSPELYQQVLAEVIQTKSRILREPDVFQRKRKLAQYALQKGFEAELIWRILQENGMPEE